MDITQLEGTTSRLLGRSDITSDITEGIARLFKFHHSRSNPPDESGLRDFVQRGKIVVALQDESVVGILLYAKSDWADHSIGSIRHFVVDKEHDACAVGKELLQTLMGAVDPLPDVVEFNGKLPHPDLASVFTALGFKTRERPVFRLLTDKRPQKKRAR